MSEDKILPNQKNGYELPKSVAVIYSDVKREYFLSEDAYIAEKDAQDVAETIAKSVEKLDIKTELYPGNVDLIDKLKINKPDVVINLVDTFKGSDYQASIIPAVFEILEVPYIGTGALGLSLSSNKYLVSQLYQASGIPVAHSQLFNTPTDFLDPTLRFPLISKLNETHGSVELTDKAVSENEKDLRERLKLLIPTYKESVLVEEFIVGREVSAILLEGLNKKVYFSEKIFPETDSKYKFLNFDLKWYSPTEQNVKFQKYEDPILKEYVKKAFSVMELFDYGKFDVRIDNSGRYFFIDTNPNTFLGPGGSMSTTLELYGVNFEETIKRLLINTVRDWQGKERLPYPKSK